MEASDYSATTSASSNGSSQSPWEAHEAATNTVGRPELPVIGAFVAGFVFAKLLRRARGVDE